MGILESFMYTIVTAMNNGTLISSFSVCILLIFSYVLILPITLITVLCFYGKNGHPCLFLHLMELL